ncbi:16S rRNA (guanine(527)-N(7))-methyltransferase RsmG [Tropicimonas sediminicola]|uniref:16S rRNA (guanine(527)-N(7))-methyltransferase RsmG n=1 Tax=Tropicimonas sediminicola TaxID=1031541 RepID=UPI000B76CC2E|nr:16S rRNA (guanine(527)-N(7))-methyltransferase RsmG [Tropicimonas sediminicola]
MLEPGDALSSVLGRDVSRETRERLETHQTLLTKWNRAINLVSPGTIENAWTRHILDSAEVFAAAPTSARKWLDFGTGGGFPGLVCAIIAAEFTPEISFTLVESDKRKSAFLTTVLRETGVTAEVVARRLEDMRPQAADVISARAVASLSDLLTYAYPHLAPGGHCLFPKGVRAEEEVASASDSWRFKLERRPSITDPNTAILVLGEIERV